MSGQDLQAAEAYLLRKQVDDAVRQEHARERTAALLRKDAPNYWADAWSERRWVEEAAGRPLRRRDGGSGHSVFRKAIRAHLS